MPSNVQQLKMTGLAVDLPAYQYPPDVWTSAKNVEMFEGFPRRARGFARVMGDTLTLPRFLQNNLQGGVSLWLYGGDTLLGVTDGNVHLDITGALVFDSTGATSPWTGGVLNQRAIMNNRTGPPMYWVSGTPDALILPDWPATRTAQSVRVFREFLVALGISESGQLDPDLIRWSDAAPQNDVPQSWTAGPQSLAGSASAAFTPGNLVDSVVLRDQLYIFKQHATYVMSLVGGRFVMQQRPVFSTVGMMSRNCGVEYRGKIILLTDGDVVITNGVEVESLVDRRVRRTIFGNIDPDNFENAFVALDKERSEVWVCFPEAGALYPTLAAVWSIEDNEWGVRDLGVNSWPHGVEGVLDVGLREPIWSSRTTEWDTDGTLWSDTGATPVQQRLTFADAGSLIQGMDVSDTFDGEPPEARLIRTGLDFGLPDKFKYVSRAWPKINGPSGSVVQVRIGGSDFAEGPVVWDDYHDVILGETESIPVNARGRYLAVEFRSDSAATWRAPSIDLAIAEMGAF